jgi:hypothetical protein
MRPLIVMWLVACGPSAGVLIDEAPFGDTGTEPVDTAIGEGFTDDPIAWTATEPQPDYSAYDDAYARISQPTASSVISIGAMQTYTVEVRDPDGNLLTPDAVAWQSSLDVDFSGTEPSFQTDTLEPGTHTLTALVDLPNGARLAHSISGVRVQDANAGTYAGLFSVDGTVQNITVTCTGAALISFGALGFVGDGDASCLVSLLGIDIPMNWVFELENVGGVVTGTNSIHR